MEYNQLINKLSKSCSTSEAEVERALHLIALKDYDDPTELCTMIRTVLGKYSDQVLPNTWLLPDPWVNLELADNIDPQIDEFVRVFNDLYKHSPEFVAYSERSQIEENLKILRSNGAGDTFALMLYHKARENGLDLRKKQWRALARLANAFAEDTGSTSSNITIFTEAMEEENGQQGEP